MSDSTINNKGKKRFLIKLFFFIAILVLILQGLKQLSVKLNTVSSTFVGIIIMWVQFYLVFAPLIVLILERCLRTIVKKKFRYFTVGFMTISLFAALESLMFHYLRHAEQAPDFLQNAIGYYYEKYDRKILTYEPGSAVYDGNLFYRLKPGARFVFRNHEFADSFAINSLGLRDDENSLQGPEVICLGDSYLMGWGVRQDSTFANLLEKKIGRKVLNAAISSYGTAREMMLLNELDRSNMKFLVIQYCVNDWVENKTYIAQQNKLGISSEGQFKKLQQEHFLNSLYFPGKHSAMLAQLVLRFSINRFRKTFNLSFDRFTKVRDEAAQAKDFLDLLMTNRQLFGNAIVFITIMDTGDRLNNLFLSEIDKLLNTTPYQALKEQTVLIHTEHLFSQKDFHFLDQHARGSAYDKLSNLVADSVSVFYR